MRLQRMDAIQAEQQRREWHEAEMLTKVCEAYPNLSIARASEEGRCDTCRYDKAAVYLTSVDGWKCGACLMDYAWDIEHPLR